MMQLLDFSDSTAVLLFIISLWIIVFLRYVLVAGIFSLVFYVFFKKRYLHRKISTQLRSPSQHWKEIAWSCCTSFIFALSGLWLVWLWQKGYTKVYIGNTHSIFFTVGSLFLAVLLHETYYYWLHRWMHRPRVYRWIHKVHHDSIITSPWTAFSFHPLESLLQAVIVPLLVLTIPMHLYTLVILLIFMTVSATINHLDIEIYPQHFEQHWLGKWLIGATHHSLHHAKFLENYGLYFTFWDKWMNTESPDFERIFQDKTRPKS